MRWIWIDRVVEIVPEKRLVAVKNVSLAEEYLHDHFPAEGDREFLPVLPASLILEGMAQTAGLLVGAAREFREKVVLAKIASATFAGEVIPGETVRYEAVIQRIDALGAATAGTVTAAPAGESARPAWRDVASIELMFSHVDQNQQGLELSEHNFVFSNNLLGVLVERAGLRPK